MLSLRLGHRLDVFYPTLHNGPGWRIGLWTQGCRHRCTTQCLSPHLLDPGGGYEVTVPDTLHAVLAAASEASPSVEGVTILGGEPFEQAAPLAALLRPLRQAGLSSMVYSGHTWEHLRQASEDGIHDLLAETDLLVDGPYLPSHYSETAAWRGSTNQRLLCLTSRFTPALLDEAFARQGKGFSLLIGGGQIVATGMQTRDAARIAEHLLVPSGGKP